MYTWSVRFGSNPCSSMRNLRIFVCPSLAALWRQVWARLSKSNLEGPKMGTRYFTTSKWPPNTARCRAFSWSYTEGRNSFRTYVHTYAVFLWHTIHKIDHKHTGFVASTSALSFSTSSLTMWRWPLRAATWTGDQPSCSERWWNGITCATQWSS